MVALAKQSTERIRNLLLGSLGSVVASRQVYSKSAAALRAEWTQDFEQACTEARGMCAIALSDSNLEKDDSFMLLGALAAFHGHTSATLLFERGPDLSCPECGDYIFPRDAS